MEIYFDNSATTPLCEAAKQDIINNLDVYGNPSSLHARGFEAEQLVTSARKKIAATLKCTKEEIIFTSCGTEANNLAIIGGAMAKIRRGNRIITTNSEHPSVSEPMKKLSEQGFEVIYLSTVGGKIYTDELREALNDKTVLVSIMHTNNETGAVYGVNNLYPIIRKLAPEALIHCDFVQGYLKSREIPDADLISVSAHKVHAPKGVGALYKKKGVRILPQLMGGGQENGLRSGTENLISLSAFGAAAEHFNKTLSADTEKMADLRKYIIEKLSEIEGVSFNLPENPAPNIISAAFEGVRSEVMLHHLSEFGIYVSSGSACSSKKGKSGVLTAFGADKNADFTLRISLSTYNTRDQADEFVSAVKNGMKRLQKVR
ncbi:MAG: cysteine desulfurase [Ruminococcaceae bacterium]|nr:cysteine desulfurase [Oscillospiraceae bacterium]